MKQSKNTKHALTASILSMIVCCAMLIGSTFAWFTDSVTSAGNKIVAGNLDVTMEWRDGKETPSSTDGWKDASTEPIFNYDKWEPGYTVARHVRISNKGNLALKYEIRIVANGEVSKLANVIDVYYIPNGKQIANRAALTDANKIGTLAEALENPCVAKGHILEGDNATDVATIALKMQETAGNEYQGLSIGTDFSIQLVATQYAHEEDSFDDQYDKDAAYPVEYAATEAQLKDAIAKVEDGGTVVLTGDIQMSDGTPVTVGAGKSVTVDMNGKKLTNTADIYDESVYSWSVFSVRGGELTLTGNGTVQAKENDSYVADLQYGGKVTIESGTFIGNISAVYVNKGELVINGGTFNIQQKSTSGAPYRFMLNCLDDNYKNGTAKITVNGGKFYQFNPADNAAEGAGTNFVADGLTAVENDGWYTVGKAVANAGELGKAVQQGGSVVLKDHVILTSPLTFSDKKVQIGLNGKELKSTAAINLIEATGAADVTIAGGNLTVENDDASVVFAQDAASVCIENCDISYSGRWGYAVVTNGGQSKDATVVMRNTDITDRQGYACYFPAGTIVLENCNVTGAVIISGGDVTIDGGTYTADGFSGQPKIWHKADTISYMAKFTTKDGCGHMGDSILIMDRRGNGYGVANVTIQNAIFDTELTLADGSKATAYAVKYVDYNNILGTERGRLNIAGNTYKHKLDSGHDPLMFIGIDGTDIAYHAQ